MDTIITFGDDYAGLIDKVQQNSILPKYKYTIKYEDLSAEKNFKIYRMK